MYNIISIEYNYMIDNITKKILFKFEQNNNNNSSIKFENACYIKLIELINILNIVNNIDIEKALEIINENKHENIDDHNYYLNFSLYRLSVGSKTTKFMELQK